MTRQLPLFGGLDRLVDPLIDQLGGQDVVHPVARHHATREEDPVWLSVQWPPVKISRTSRTA